MFVFVVCQYFYVVLCCFYATALFFQKKNKNILMKTTDSRFAIPAYVKARGSESSFRPLPLFLIHKELELYLRLPYSLPYTTYSLYLHQIPSRPLQQQPQALRSPLPLFLIHKELELYLRLPYSLPYTTYSLYLHQIPSRPLQQQPQALRSCIRSRSDPVSQRPKVCRT